MEMKRYVLPRDKDKMIECPFCLISFAGVAKVVQYINSIRLNFKVVDLKEAELKNYILRLNSQAKLPELPDFFTAVVDLLRVVQFAYFSSVSRRKFKTCFNVDLGQFLTNLSSKF